MAKTKIAPTAEETATASTALTTTETTAVVPSATGDHYSDETSRDVQLPVIGLVNKVGKLAEKFENQGGKFVVGDVLVGPTVSVIPINVLKLYSEFARNGQPLVYGKDQPQVWNSEREANAAGYFIDRTHRVPNRIEEIAKIGFLAVAPAGDTSGEFFLKVGELQVAPCYSTYRRGGYINVYLPVFNHANRLCMAQGIVTRGLTAAQIFRAAKGWTNLWTLGAKKGQNDTNTWWEPQIAKGAPLAGEVVEYISANYGG